MSTKRELEEELKITDTGKSFLCAAKEQQSNDDRLLAEKLAKIKQIIQDYDNNCGLEEYMYLEQIKEILEQE